MKWQKHEKFANVSNSILRGMKIIGKDLFRKAALETIMTEKGIDEIEKNLTEKMAFLDSLDKETIYFDGIENISEQFRRIRRLKKDKDYRVVVFIDDLDRCSPKKALQVLESIKVFLDIEGFVYVIGISVETINRLISYAYKETGIQGKEYIKKIIQIPIRIPKWDNLDINKLILEDISKKLPNQYKKFVISNASIIAKSADYNPRQVKRFINNIIIAMETFAKNSKKHSMDLGEILFVQVMVLKFPLIVEYLKNPITGKIFEKGINILSHAMKNRLDNERRRKKGLTVFGSASRNNSPVSIWIKSITSDNSDPDNKREIRRVIFDILKNEMPNKNRIKNQFCSRQIIHNHKRGMGVTFGVY